MDSRFAWFAHESPAARPLCTGLMSSAVECGLSPFGSRGGFAITGVHPEAPGSGSMNEPGRGLLMGGRAREAAVWSRETRQANRVKALLE